MWHEKRMPYMKTDIYIYMYVSVYVPHFFYE